MALSDPLELLKNKTHDRAVVPSSRLQLLTEKQCSG